MRMSASDMIFTDFGAFGRRGKTLGGQVGCFVLLYLMRQCLVESGLSVHLGRFEHADSLFSRLSDPVPEELCAAETSHDNVAIFFASGVDITLSSDNLERSSHTMGTDECV